MKFRNLDWPDWCDVTVGPEGLGFSVRACFGNAYIWSIAGNPALWRYSGSCHYYATHLEALGDWADTQAKVYGAKSRQFAQWAKSLNARHKRKSGK